jgi:hypothetical protein
VRPSDNPGSALEDGWGFKDIHRHAQSVRLSQTQHVRVRQTGFIKSWGGCTRSCMHVPTLGWRRSCETARHALGYCQVGLTVQWVPASCARRASGERERLQHAERSVLRHHDLCAPSLHNRPEEESTRARTVRDAQRTGVSVFSVPRYQHAPTKLQSRSPSIGGLNVNAEK